MSVSAPAPSFVEVTRAPPTTAGLRVLGRRSNSVLLVVFTAAIFTSAFLLFLVQPMFSKLVLPLLGGAPAVWNTCMLFFQAVLLAGYLYAHLSTRWLGVRRQAVLHLALLACALAVLPISIPAGWQTPGSGSPVLWLLGLLSVTLGLPFFVLSSSAPLLQKWFSATRHRDADNPYFLYAASNLGSMLALLAYPVLVEPRLRLSEQSTAWAAGFGVLLLLTSGCAVLLYRTSAPCASEVALPETKGIVAARVSPTQRMWWIVLAFAPSSLLLGVTQTLTTDVAAVPLLWVLPLAIYLLTFILVFARRTVLRQRWLARAQPFLVIPAIGTIIMGGSYPLPFIIPLHLLTFFVVAMLCHGALARSLPPTRHLTEFYLWMSLGGAMGGVFNVLIAPALFTGVLEYPLVLIFACMLVPGQRWLKDPPRMRLLDLVLPVAVGAVLSVAVFSAYRLEEAWGYLAALVTLGLCLVVCFGSAERPIRYGLVLLAVFFGGRPIINSERNVLFAERSFFGVNRVTASSDGKYHLLMHGSTLHGAQSTEGTDRLEPLTYYTRTGPIGQVFAALPPQGAGRRVAVVGLGTGSLACYGSPADRWTFYEIDPVVARIARDSRYFTFIRDCAPSAAVVMGDARISMLQAEAGEYDVIVLDAFSSDAIPIHLITREALSLYLRKLAPGGAIAFHISNRHLNLEPMLRNLAADAGLVALAQADGPREAVYEAPSRWVVVARGGTDLGALTADERWKVPRSRDGVGVWTDDFSNILSVFGPDR